jgi:hypothetical protein
MDRKKPQKSFLNYQTGYNVIDGYIMNFFGYIESVDNSIFLDISHCLLLDKPSFFAIFLVPILGFRFFKFLIVIQSSIEITSKPPAINQEYFSNSGGSIFNGKSGSILGGNLQLKMWKPDLRISGK